MKINTVNKIYILLALLLACYAGYRTMVFKPWDRYYYFASAMLPASYPVHLRELHFDTENPDDFISINTENTDFYRAQWGEEYYFPETYSSELLPKRLVIQYLDYRSKNFYRDSIDLPTAEIRKYFKEAAKKGDMQKIYNYGVDAKGLTFLVGIANAGNIIVWLRTATKDHIISKTKLQPKDPRPEDLYFDGLKDFETYYKEVFRDMPDSLKMQIDAGWDQDAQYIDSLAIPKSIP